MCEPDNEYIERQLDTRGLLCPEPLMLLRNAVRALNPGECLEILATDPSTERDFSNFCRFMGHDLVSADREPAGPRAEPEQWRFVVRKAAQ